MSERIAMMFFCVRVIFYPKDLSADLIDFADF